MRGVGVREAGGVEKLVFCGCPGREQIVFLDGRLFCQRLRRAGSASADVPCLGVVAVGEGGELQPRDYVGGQGGDVRPRVARSEVEERS